MRLDLAAVGETMAMIAPARIEPLVDADELRLHVGGAESNVALQLSGLGHPVSWTSRLGDDPFGHRVARVIAAGGVDTSSVVFDADAPTGVYFKDPGADGTRVHYYRRNSAAARMDVTTLPSIPLDRTRIVHLTGITPALSAGCAALVDAVIAEARRRGVLVSFDVNYRRALWPVTEAGPAIERIAGRCDLVLVGRDEAEILWGTASAADIRRLLPGPGRLVVKDGDVGATEFLGEHGVTFAPALPVEVVEAVGAGDAFAAGYLSGMLGDLSSADALGRGHRLAARALATLSDGAPAPVST